MSASQLVLTDKQKEDVAKCVGCTVIRGADGSIVAVWPPLDRSDRGTYLKGSFWQIVRYFEIEYPPFEKDCIRMEVNEPLTWRAKVELTVRKYPVYTGRDTGRAAVLLSKYRRVGFSHKDFMENLLTRWSNVEQSPMTDNVLRRKDKRKKAAQSATKSRIERGKIPQYIVRNIQYSLAYDIRRVLLDETDGALWSDHSTWPRTVGGCAYRTLMMDLFIRKYGLRVFPAACDLKAAKPYIPGLLKHEDKFWRAYGRYLRRICSEKRPRGSGKRRSLNTHGRGKRFCSRPPAP